MSMPATTATVLEWALWYAQHGHPVFPVHTPLQGGCSCRKPTCSDRGKHPRTLHGLLDATTNEDTIRRWWKQWPLANIGLRTGVTFWVLDVDPRKGGDTELALLEATHGKLPITPHALTGGGGVHIPFALPPHGTIKNGVEILPGLDVRGDGGYIVVPPSLHLSGTPYTWELTAELEDVPLAQAPTWLLDLVRTSTHTAPLSPEEPIGEGKRNETLSRMAYHMRTAGMSLEEILNAIRGVNGRCVPPLDEEELKIIAYGKRDIAPDPILRTRKNGTNATPDAWPDLTHGQTIMETTYPSPIWVIPGLITEGLTIVGGLPKVSKSYFAYDLALAGAGNGLGLGYFGVRRGTVAYFAIEDDESDTQTRLRELRGHTIVADDLYFLHGENVPTINNRLVEYLRIKVTQYQLSIVIIDPLSYIYDPPQGKQVDSFREAKDMLLPLRQLARELHFALILVDHRRKQSKDDNDVFQTLYGSVGKYAIADTLIMMVRDDTEVRLHCRGRKIKDQVISCTLVFENDRATWNVIGAHENYREATIEAKIIEAFQEAKRLLKKYALTLTEIVDFAGLEQTRDTKEKFRVTLFRMVKAGRMIKSDRNQFAFAGTDDMESVEV